MEWYLEGYDVDKNTDTSTNVIISRLFWDMYVSYTELHPMWHSKIIWRHRSGLALAHVMACCLAAPNHRLNQYCWTVKPIYSHIPQPLIISISLEIIVPKISFKSPRGQWVNSRPAMFHYRLASGHQNAVWLCQQWHTRGLKAQIEYQWGQELLRLYWWVGHIHVEYRWDKDCCVYIGEWGN